MSDEEYNDDLEKALLATIAVSGRADLLDRLDPQVFGGIDNRLFFSELRLMHEAGHPLGDTMALSRWFVAKSTKRRWSNAHGDAYYPPAVAAEVGARHASVANLDYYLREVFVDWAMRAQRFIASAWLKDLEGSGDSPTAIFSRFQSMLDRYYEKTAERFPESLEGTV